MECLYLWWLIRLLLDRQHHELRRLYAQSISNTDMTHLSMVEEKLESPFSANFHSENIVPNSTAS